MVARHRSLHLLASAMLVGICLALVFPGCGDEERAARLLSDCVDRDTSIVDFATAGLNGIKLKVETRCVFQIDMSTSTPLRWCRFVQRFPTAYVRMKVKIDETGKVVDIFGKKDGGQPAALEQIVRAVKGWKYEGGCLEGAIYMEFNAAMSRLTFDDSRLTIVPGYEHCDISRYRIHRVWQGCNFGAFRRALEW